jgi:hypothetical protein
MDLFFEESKGRILAFGLSVLLGSEALYVVVGLSALSDKLVCLAKLPRILQKTFRIGPIHAYIE